VIYVDGKRIKVKYTKWGTKEYELDIFKKSNQKTLIHQYPRVSLGQKVKEWDIIAEWSAVQNGEIAVGKNLRVAFMPWEGFNYEDAIVISNRLVKDDTLTSIHIEEYEIEVSETKLGPEETTNDIPWVSLSKLKILILMVSFVLDRQWKDEIFWLVRLPQRVNENLRQKRNLFKQSLVINQKS
jgi:DNA-directed RNA polymerase subunit beta